MIADGFPLFPAIAAIGGLTGVAAIITAVFRLRPDVNRVTVSAAEGAVIVQTGVIESLSAENVRLQKRIDALEATVHSFAEMRTRIAALETERMLLKTENVGLRERIQMLESEVAGLRGPLTDEDGTLIDRREEP